MVRDPRQKILTRERAIDLAAGCRAEGRRLVTTNGCFDLLHWGHIRYLNEARNLGDLLLVAINSDESVSALKGPTRPLQNLTLRQLQIAGLECVDYVVGFSEITPEALLRDLKPAIHVKGGDYDPSSLPESAVVHEFGGAVVCVSLEPGLSTTALLERAAR